MSGRNNTESSHSRLAIIAALQREIAPIIHGWKHRDVEHGGKTLRFYESEKAVLVCGGIGASAAHLAAEAAVNTYHPEALVSAGLAGSLTSGVKVGEAFLAANVIDAASGKGYSTGPGIRILVTANKILGSEEKRALAQRFAAHAVDMEAAAVAEVAAQAGLPFFAVKAISDELEFPMPPMDKFVDVDGNFDTGKFVLHATLRPAMWPVVFRLARNSSRAAKALVPLIQHLIENQDLSANAIESKLAKFDS
ncbi:MAG TPA: hypothetical protein VK738_16510 [Terriglobales bacterium]|jgi:adenosylhomocysteine nucleosidase|nr:hypothetical protein [Terriglobales bacterium]